MGQVTLGGERLGSGKKEKVELRNYERSSHDLSYIWRSTMASGTLVPFMSEVGLPGDSFDIDLDVDIKTHPTIGPLFGSYKVQLDVFSCPIRLYNGKLHMNMLNIGLNMAEIKLPQIQIYAKSAVSRDDNEQIDPSTIYSYLGIRGIGRNDDQEYIYRNFNAIPYLAYWDIYKNYYANKQEEIGAVIHNTQDVVENNINRFKIWTNGTGYDIDSDPNNPDDIIPINSGTYATITFENQNEPDLNNIYLNDSIPPYKTNINSLWENVIWNEASATVECYNIRTDLSGTIPVSHWSYTPSLEPDNKPKVVTFPLENIDTMRKDILTAVNQSSPFIIGAQSIAPYGLGLQQSDQTYLYSKQSTQEGLGLKTYQSDLFNNWISTEWLDGDNGINQITAIDTSSGEFSIDTLLLSRKVYDMLNRIAISGGSYDDWLDAVYSHERTRSIENPMYMGGLIRELAFQEVISNAQAVAEGTIQPLGTLAGRGTLTNKKKGGKINVRVNEPSYIMGIISLTPRVDYSQGNKWDTNLRTMDDFHKPALDEIGFQDLITDQMAWWDTEVNGQGRPQFKSAGKQPAWINYMTNVNVCRGNFAKRNQQMYMTLNRRYEQSTNGIKDLTTYIDPSKFNHIFADTRIDAQNFWAQIGVNIYARRKMSAKIMPNL